MATKKTVAPPPQLVRDKEELKAQIQERMQQGVHLLGIPVSTPAEKAAVWTSFRRWDELNYEIIASAFDQRRNVHENDYLYREGIDLLALNGMRAPKTLGEEIQEDHQAIVYQLERLKAFYDKIDLQHVARGVQPKALVMGRDDLDKLLHLLHRFHKVAQKLRERHDGRATLAIRDEYDVQDLLFSLLQIDFEDVRKEEYSPSLAGANSRIDFVLKLPGILIETKMSSDQLTDKKMGAELLVDIGRYKEYPDARQLVIFIYDKGDHISNKKGLIRDLEKQSTPALKIHVVINPQ
jgi:hypothetical protein